MKPRVTDQMASDVQAVYGGSMVVAPGPCTHFYYKNNTPTKYTKRAWRMFGYCMLAGATREVFASRKANKYNLMASGVSWGAFPIMIASQSFEVLGSS